jgi:ABC-type transport system involved in multi-copper enzyme maturation permease subunit
MGPTNPITVRLVQSGSRRVKHLYVRSAYLAVLIVVLLWSLLLNTGAGTPSYRELAEAGASSFVMIAYLQIGLICVLAPVFMASAIAQESNPKTWDIILTTPLGPGQIVLGNLFGRLFFVLALLFSSLPLFAITQYFGGVPGRAIFASYFIAATAALVVGATAVALSVSRLVGRRAVFAFYVCVISYLAVTAVLDTLFAPGRVSIFTGLNPFLAQRALLEPATYPRAEVGTHGGLLAFLVETPVTAWLVLSCGVSVLLMAASAVTVRAGGLQTLAGQRSAGVPWYRKMMGLGAKGAEYRPPRSVWTNPIAGARPPPATCTFWKILGRWAFVVAGIVGALVLLYAFHDGMLSKADFRVALLGVVWTEFAVVALIAINTAATAISREREDGTLDLLLTTPMTPARRTSAASSAGSITYLLPLLRRPRRHAAARRAVRARRAGHRPARDHVRPRCCRAATTVTLDVPVVLPEAGLVAAASHVAVRRAVRDGRAEHESLRSKGTLGAVVATVALIGVIAGIAGLCGWQSGSARCRCSGHRWPR